MAPSVAAPTALSKSWPRASTLFIGTALVAFSIPAILRWGAHDGGILGVLAFLVFPWCAVIGLVLASINLIRARSARTWVEFALAASMIGFVAWAFL